MAKKKHRRDGMSRLGTSRNVQWSAEGARKCVYPRFQNLVNLSSPDQENLDERTKKKGEKLKFEKMKIVILAKKT